MHFIYKYCDIDLMMIDEEIWVYAIKTNKVIWLRMLIFKINLCTLQLLQK